MLPLSGARSVVVGSDEIYDCDHCKSQGRKREAEFYCKQCLEFLCTRCTEQHKRFKMSRDHNVVNISKPGLVVSSDKHLCGPCESDGRRQAANHYCETCSEYFCNSCRNEHKSFKISKDHKIWSTTAPRQDQTVTGGLQTSPSEGLSKLSIGHHPTLTGMGLPSLSTVYHHSLSTRRQHHLAHTSLVTF